MKVLLTGASGFIGRHALPLLSERADEVHAVCSGRSAPESEALSGVVWHRADLLDDDTVRKLITQVRPTHLLHLAWYATPGKFWTSPQNLRWVAASLEIFRQFAASGGQRVVVAGTCAEYSCELSALIEAVSPTRPASLYGACKHALHVMLEAFAQQSGLSYAWGRIFFPYGPHEHPDRLIAYAVSSMLQREVVNFTHGRQVRDLMYVEDVANALVSVLDSEIEGPVDIGCGKGVALMKVIEKIADRLQAQDLVRLGTVAARADEPAVIVADVKRLRDEVGYIPHYTLEQGLDATIEWWKTAPGRSE